MQLSPARQGFSLPANPDPPDYLCVTVPIPNDPAHVAAFLGVMYDLTLWLSWQSDTAHTAIKASTVWKKIFLQIQDEIGKCHTSGEQVAILEDFMSVCQQLRIHNGRLQGLCCFDAVTGEATWEDIQGQEGGFLPSGASQPGPTPRPGPAASKCYNVLLNANSQWTLPFAVNDGDQITISAVDGIWSDGNIGDYCPDGTPYVLGQCIGVQGHVSDDPDTTDFHMQAIAIVGPLFYPASGGVFTIPGGTGSQSLVLQANDGSLGDNRGSISLMICVESGATPPVETWCSVIDFTASDYGWTPYSPGSEHRAVYVAGQGWAPDTSLYGGLVQIQSPGFSSRSVTYIEILLSIALSGPTHTACANMPDRTGADNCITDSTITDFVVFNDPAGFATTGIFLNVASDDDSSGPDWPGFIRRIIVKGIGTNPFGANNC